MTPTEVKKLEAKIERLEEKLDFVIHHYVQQEEDWIDDPLLLPILNKRLEEAKNGRSYTEEEVYQELGL